MCRSHIFNETQANDCISVLKTLCNDNSKKLIFAYINIDLIKNKFEFFSNQVTGKIDVAMVSETKHGNNFSGWQFCYK